MESATSMARSSPPVPLPPSEFHDFIEFPSEIRLKIWRLTMPPLRCLRICYFPEPTPRDWKLKEKLLPPREKSCTRRVPVILQVCNESREEGLRVYQLSLAALFPDHTIYFSDGTNIIYLERTELSMLWCLADIFWEEQQGTFAFDVFRKGRSVITVVG